MKKCKIKVTGNGPYPVLGGVPLSRQIIIADAENTVVEWREDEKYAFRESYALCRFGRSSNMHFCDSSHYPEEHEHGAMPDE